MGARPGGWRWLALGLLPLQRHFSLFTNKYFEGTECNLQRPLPGHRLWRPAKCDDRREVSVLVAEQDNGVGSAVPRLTRWGRARCLLLMVATRERHRTACTPETDPQATLLMNLPSSDSLTLRFVPTASTQRRELERQRLHLPYVKDEGQCMRSEQAGGR